MKKLIAIIFAVSAIFTSCEMHDSENGNLDGYWYLTRVDTIATGGVNEYRGQRIFWSFQGTLLQMNRIDIDCYYMASFSHKGNELVVENPYLYDRNNGGYYIADDTMSEIMPFGLNSINESFTLKTLDDHNMVLDNGKLRLCFERY